MKTVRFGELFELERIPLITASQHMYSQIGIRSFGKGIFYRKPVAEHELSKLRYFEVRPHRIVFSNIMAWEGAVGITDVEADGYVASQRFLSYVPTSDNVNLSYYNFFFQSEAGIRLLRTGSTGTVKRNQTLSPHTIEEFIVPQPSINEQERISLVLTKAFANANRLKLMAEDRRNRIPTSLPLLIDAVIDRYSTSVASVSDLTEIVNDTVHPGDDPGEAREFVGLEYIAQHLGIKLSSRPVGSEGGRKFRFGKGDVLYGYLRPYQNKVWHTSHAGLCSVEQFVLRSESPAVARYLAYVIRGQRVLDRVDSLTNSLQLPRLSSKAFLAISVPTVAPTKLAEALDTLDSLNATIVRAWHCSKRTTAVTNEIGSSLLNFIFTEKL